MPESLMLRPRATYSVSTPMTTKHKTPAWTQQPIRQIGSSTSKAAGAV
jgi:hypothetical protein